MFTVHYVTFSFCCFTLEVKASPDCGEGFSLGVLAISD
jgi:hypothetical protein